MKTTPEKLNTVLVTDCGSTTTKALFFQRTKDGWRQTCRGEAPTTVEEPVADVTVGAVNAFTEVQEVSGRKILKSTQADEAPFVISNGIPEEGIDLYLSTSSAGGGLQMMVSGVVRTMTTESAERAALGAGAIVMDALSADDRREDHERIERIRHLRPDIVLLTGGVDGGSKVHVVEAAEILLAASPRPRFGDTLKLPVIFAGNKEAAEEVKEILRETAQISIVENVRPTLEQENLGPAREAIHEFFLSHVMSHSPGYGKLLSWTPVAIMPTPAAVGDMVVQHAEEKDLQVLCVDIGGATTDVFSVFKNEEDEAVFNRTVSANLGMSYSVANVLIEAGASNISRWIPHKISDNEVRDRLRNKMIRPTSIPQTQDDLWLEQAVCREALRLSLQHHTSLAVGLSGVQKQRGIADIFSQSESRYELVNMLKLDLVIGSGGVLSHAPNRMGAALMMLDGFQLQGFTQIAVDSIFMMPHLGVFSSVYPKAAREIFIRDCLVNVAHSIVPVTSRKKKLPKTLAKIYLDGALNSQVELNELSAISLEEGQSYKLRIEPTEKYIDVGAGPGEDLEREFIAGACGLILDGRGRPLDIENTEEQHDEQRKIFETLGLIKV